MNSINESVLFLPGTLCDERIWLPIWQNLSFEQRLYSPLQWAQSLQDMLALTQDRLDQANGKVHLVGYSMGGYIAALAALQSPEQVASITLIAYDPYGLSQNEVATRQVLIKSLTKQPKMKLGNKRLSQFFTVKELQEAGLSQTVIDMQNDLGNQTLLNQIKATTPRKDLSKQLASLNIPINFIAAHEDQIAKLENIQAFCDQNKHAQACYHKGTAHMLVLSKADLIAQQIADFVLGLKG